MEPVPPARDRREYCWITRQVLISTSWFQCLLFLFSRPVLSNSFQPHGLGHARPLCPSPSPEVSPSSCPLHRWCHPANSSSDALFSCPQSFPESGTFPVSQFFASGSQSIGVFSFSISPSNEYSGLISFRMDWLGLLAAQGTLKSLLQHHNSKASSLQCSAFFIIQLSHPYMTTGKTIALTRWTFVDNVSSGDPGSIPDQETRSHMLQTKSLHPGWRLKIPHTATKTWRSQIYKYLNNNNKTQPISCPRHIAEKSIMLTRTEMPNFKTFWLCYRYFYIIWII